jgi:hypothetical protein
MDCVTVLQGSVKASLRERFLAKSFDYAQDKLRAVMVSLSNHEPAKSFRSPLNDKLKKSYIPNPDDWNSFRKITAAIRKPNSVTVSAVIMMVRSCPSTGFSNWAIR